MKPIVSALLSLPFFSFATVFPCAAQQFQTPVYYQVSVPGAQPGQMVSADFNRDGNLDLAVVDPDTGGVSILLGNGDGTFTTGKGLPIPDPYTLATADVNGDGIPDLLVQQWDEDFMVFLGKGDGTFTLKSKFQGDAYPINFVVADLNGDGHADLAIANSNNDHNAPGNVSVYFGRGDGTFVKSAQYFAGKHPWGISAADLNGDGRVDLVVGDDNNTGGNDTLFVLLNKGNGTFRNTGFYQTGLESVGITIADLNHDGKLDVIVASAFDQGIYVLLGNGDGTVAVPVFYTTGSFGAAPYQAVVADFNHDGNPDIAVTLYDIYDGGPLIFYGNGDGTFQPAVAAVTPGPGGQSLVTGDFNRDGAPDLAVSVFGSGQVGVVLNGH
jgi:FG-GAP-like repeat